MNNNTKYTNVAIVLHWLIGIAILFMFVLGWFMTELPKETPKTTSFDIFTIKNITIMIKNCEHFFFHVCLSGKGFIEWLRLIRLAAQIYLLNHILLRVPSLSTMECLTAPRICNMRINRRSRPKISWNS